MGTINKGVAAADADQRRIREYAYQLWELRGRRMGEELRNWLDAESELLHAATAAASRRALSDVDASLDATFPASDPPASHSPDVPPANAGKKWAAVRDAEEFTSQSEENDT